jgi:FKBP-type peptidyl-prolyl cis-trans isomerase FkpA
MHHKYLIIFIFSLSLLLLLACQQPTHNRDEQGDAETVRSSLRGANSILIDAEKQDIEDFIQRHGWSMKSTGSGLRYMIYEEGKGPEASKDKTAIFHYTLRLITGDVIYSSRNGQPSDFVIGRGGVESGLDEGIQLLRQGDKARLILPSHLAHGVPGDGVKIPLRAILVYDIELLEVR